MDILHKDLRTIVCTSPVLYYHAFPHSVYLLNILAHLASTKDFSVVEWDVCKKLTVRQWGLATLAAGLASPDTLQLCVPGFTASHVPISAITHLDWLACSTTFLYQLSHVSLPCSYPVSLPACVASPSYLPGYVCLPGLTWLHEVPRD